MPDPVDRPKWENSFSRAVNSVFKDMRPEIESGPLSFSWPTFQGRIAAAVEKEYTEAFIAAYLILFFDDALRRSDMELPDIEPADVNQIGARYGRVMSGRLAQEITDATKTKVRGSIDETGLIKDPERFDNAFSKDRVENIAITETTRSISEGENAARVEIERVGNREIVAIWITEKDSKVCPICRPNHRKPESFWVDKFPKGPPAHPRCRCNLFYEVR